MLRKRLLKAGLLLLILIVLSITGYKLLGGPSISFLQALYMAVITVAGVGYGEIVPTEGHPALRIFNIFVVLFGVAVTVYVFSVVAAFIVEVEATNPFWRRRMQKRIQELKNHYVVCGLGDTGRHAVEELKKTGTPFVAIEVSEENLKKWKELHPELFNDMLYVVGDATEEEILEKAGIERAKGLITALPHDKDNLVVTVVVHQRFPNMRIVARSAEQKFSDRMLRAGANATVSPSRIGGLRMASEAIRPAVVGFLDLMLKEQAQTLRVEEIEIEERSRWVGKTLGDLKINRQYNLLVLAVKLGAGASSRKMWVNPPESLTVQGNTAIIVMGDLKDLQQARHDARPALIAAP